MRCRLGDGRASSAGEGARSFLGEPGRTDVGRVGDDAGLCFLSRSARCRALSRGGGMGGMGSS